MTNPFYPQEEEVDVHLNPYILSIDAVDDKYIFHPSGEDGCPPR